MKPGFKILSILMILLSQDIQAVKVYEFGITPEENAKLIITNDKPTPEAFTLCVDFSYRFEKNKRLLKTKNAEDLEIQIDRYSYEYESTVIRVRVAGIWYLTIPDWSPSWLDPFIWYTLCISYDIKTQEFILAFRNRLLVEEVNFVPNRTLPEDFLKYLSLGEKTSMFQFSGDLTRINIWSKAIDKETLKDITNCQDPSYKELPDILNWDYVEATIDGGVVEKELSDYPCKAGAGAEEVIDVLMTEPAISMFDAVKTCNSLAGSLSFPSTKEDVSPFLTKVMSQLPYSRCESYIWSNYYKNSNADYNWTIYKSVATYQYPPFQYPGWIDWAVGQPKMGMLKCAGIDIERENKKLNDLTCKDEGYCFMCR